MPADSYQVKWSVYFDSKQKQYASGKIVTEKEVAFLKQNKTGLSGRVKDDYLRELWHKIYGDGHTDEVTGKYIPSVLTIGRNAAKQIEDYFSFEIFARVIAGDFKPETKATVDADLIKALENKAIELIAEGDMSNGNLFNSAAMSLRRYTLYAKLAKSIETAKLPIPVVTAKFLRLYEKWMLVKGKAPQKKDGEEKPASITTVAIYIARIRKIFNDAKRAKIIKDEDYPFGDQGYKIPEVLNKKKALSDEVLLKIFNYQCKLGSSRDKWKDMWLFIYLGNGLNTVDLCKIKHKDVHYKNAEITFFRDKTMETKREGMSKISIALLPELLNIIEKWKTDDKDPESFLFPFLPKNVTPQQEKPLVNQVTKNINLHMNKIANELGIEGKINTYEARHSFATSLLRSEAPLTFISRSLGHGSLKTTQKYLGSFEDISTKRFIKDLVPKNLTADSAEEAFLKHKAQQCIEKFPAILSERMTTQIDGSKIEENAPLSEWIKYFCKWENTVEGSDFWFEVWLLYKEHGNELPNQSLLQLLNKLA
ncbi:site-specific integrase [Dyadobacter sp. CY345]|uniref:tyrosine-type recombinase/integrase n=1 Tax=Dyadobacter sp. CY345 TaxID=2909335 RepID=UPI001F1D079C|nr:tyrosine-type recombinase/integrase [Dyadobacter sp. CY345]MCF2443667.1 site-specific integrase [Dyadobacter sp. CY345]